MPIVAHRKATVAEWNRKTTTNPNKTTMNTNKIITKLHRQALILTAASRPSSANRVRLLLSQLTAQADSSQLSRRAFIQHGMGEYIHSFRRANRNSAGDALRTPLAERLRDWRSKPLALLGKLGKDEPGQLVSFEIECQLSRETALGLNLPLLAGRPHQEHDGVEIPVVCRWDDLRPLYRTCSLLRAAGATLTRQFGGHVHLDARDLYTPTSGAYRSQPSRSLKARIDKIVVPYVERVLRWAVPPSRIGNGYCKLQGADWRGHDRFRAVNVQSLSEHRTLEIRLGACTLNPDKFRLWALACLFGLRGEIGKEQVSALKSISTPRAAADWVMASTMEPTLKWWVLSRIRKFHPGSLPDLPPADDAPGSDA